MLVYLCHDIFEELGHLKCIKRNILFYYGKPYDEKMTEKLEK